MKRLRSVLVGIDFSAASDNALREAARIAKWDQAKLTALNVLGEGIVAELGEHAPSIKDEVLAEAGGRIHLHLEETLGSGHGVGGEFVIGNPLKGVLDAIKEHSAELLVLGSHGFDQEDPHRVGHLASRLTHKAPVNVLLVRDRQTGPFRKVVGCIDFSPNSAKAAVHAVHVAQQDSAALEFVHVHRPLGARLAKSGFFTAVDPMAMDVDLEKKELERVEEKLEEFLEPLVTECGGHPFSSVVLSGAYARPAIIEYLNEVDADLAVVGTRGHTGLRNLLIGSTAEKIIIHAPCSVLAIKPDGFDYELH